jgi:outer membrane translocation and assembly module TamA
MRHGLARSAVFALACAGICPAPTRAQALTPEAAEPAADALQRNLIPRGQDRSELQPHVADDPSELKPRNDASPREIQVDEVPLDASQPVAAAAGVSDAASPATQEINPCAPSPTLPDRHVLGAVTVAKLTLNGDLRLPPRDQNEITSSIKQQSYFGNPDEVTAAILERVRAAWQNRGYFKVQVDDDMKVLTSDAVSMRIALAVHVDAGQQYRLGQITFRGNRAIGNIRALRSLFPLREGDLLSRAAVAEGLENLRAAYLQIGYVNFAFIPNTEIDEPTQTISLAIDTDEGKQFFVSSIDAVGLDGQASENILKDSLLKPGDIYNNKLADRFAQEHTSFLPSGTPPSSRVRLHFNQSAGTVAIAFDFRRCPVE